MIDSQTFFTPEIHGLTYLKNVNFCRQVSLALKCFEQK